MKELSVFSRKVKNRFKNLRVVKCYNKWLYKPVKFISTAISWSIFCVLLICAAFLIYYYVSLQIYAKNGAGYEPKFSLYTIISGSMYPTIEVYDVVFVVDVDEPSDIEVGDIVSYNSSSFVSGSTISVTHRIVEITVDKDNNYTYYTKGDNNLSKDPEGISFSQIVGTVEMKIPQLGRLQFFLASKIGWLLVIILPALFIIIKYIVQLVNMSKLFIKIPSDSVFFPLFNKPILLTYKGINVTENVKENENTNTLKMSEYSKLESVEFINNNRMKNENNKFVDSGFKKSEEKCETNCSFEQIKNINSENSNLHPSDVQEIINVNQTLLDTSEDTLNDYDEDKTIDLADIFEDLKNLTK